MGYLLRSFEGCLAVYRVEMLRSYLRASPSGAQAHRIPICYCINCMYCTVFTVYTVYCTHMIWVAARKESLLNQQSLQELCVIQVSSDVHRECFRMPRTRRFKRSPSLHVRTSTASSSGDEPTGACFQNQSNQSLPSCCSRRRQTRRLMLHTIFCVLFQNSRWVGFRRQVCWHLLQ